MEIYKKIRDAIDIIKNSKLKKLGYNDYSKYYYYTPEQVSKLVYDACKELNLFIKFDLFTNEFGIFGQMSIIDIENSNEFVTYNMTTDIPKITATNSTQQLGGAMTYTKRYMLMNAFDIVDNTLDFDTPQNKETTKSTNKNEPENWLNVHPSKASKALTFDFILSWERVNVYGEKIQNIRNDFKIAKDTALKLNDKEMVSIISDENYTKTLDGNLDQINTVLKKFAMKKDQRAELKEIVLASQIDNLEQSGITYEDIR